MDIRLANTLDNTNRLCLGAGHAMSRARWAGGKLAELSAAAAASSPSMRSSRFPMGRVPGHQPAPPRPPWPSWRRAMLRAKHLAPNRTHNGLTTSVIPEKAGTHSSTRRENELKRSSETPARLPPACCRACSGKPFLRPPAPSARVLVARGKGFLLAAPRDGAPLGDRDKEMIGFASTGPNKGMPAGKGLQLCTQNGTIIYD